MAVINATFARRIFGFVSNAIGSYYKRGMGPAFRLSALWKTASMAFSLRISDPRMFLPLLQRPTHLTDLVVRSDCDPQELATDIRSRLRSLDSGLPFTLQTWTDRLAIALFPSHVATVSLGVLGIMGAMLSITGIFGMAAYSVSKRLRELGIRVALGAQRKEVLQAALGRAVKLLAIGSAAGLGLGILATHVLVFIVYQATPRDPLVLAGVVLAMALLGLLATWIPAQRALSVDPLVLLRED